MPSVLRETSPSQAAADLLLRQLEQHLRSSNVLLLLSGGSATEVYTKLAQSDPLAGNYLLHIGQIDERYDANPLHEASNNRAIRSTDFIHNWQEVSEYFPILHGDSAAIETADYDDWLAGYLADPTWHTIGLLGIGADGHTAGMLPDRNEKSFIKRFDGDKLVTYYESSSPQPKRITLTLPALRALDQSILLAGSHDKKAIVAKALADAPRPPLHLIPATIVQDMADVTVITAR